MKLIAKKVSRDFFRQTKDSNTFCAVEPTDFTLEPGKLTVLTGRSGSGKTTFMNMLAGLLAPTGGEVLAVSDAGADTDMPDAISKGAQSAETDLYAMDDTALSAFRNQHFGYIPQGQSAISSLNVLENILLPFSLYGKTCEDQAYVDELISRLGLTELVDVMPSALSGGELRRMAVARALIQHPEVIFADEPTGDLDDENTRIVFGMLRKAADEGAAVMLVTHEEDARSYADVFCKMASGVLTVEG